MGEDAKVAIRNERRDANDKIKKQEKKYYFHYHYIDTKGFFYNPT